MLLTDKQFEEKYGIGYYQDIQFLTQSMIKSYCRDKNYYKELYIDKKREREVTAAMEIGSAVDCYLTEGEEQFHKSYILKKKYMNKAEKAEYNELLSKYNLTPLTQTNWELVLSLIDRLKQSQFVQELVSNKKVLKQPILTYEDEELKLKGKLDFLYYDKLNKKGYIIDLKTTQEGKSNPHRYKYHAESLGYFRQMAYYQYLVAMHYEVQASNITCFHLVVEKDKDGIHDMNLFRFDNARLEYEMSATLDIIREIKEDTEYKRKDITFDDAIPVGEIITEELLEL